MGLGDKGYAGVQASTESGQAGKRASGQAGKRASGQAGKQASDEYPSNSCSRPSAFAASSGLKRIAEPRSIFANHDVNRDRLPAAAWVSVCAD